ncbi:MAG: universal stress protein [Dehalococcoidia bacterium]
MIPQIKKILFAVDFTENSAYAFFYAIDLAQKQQASICLLHVLEPLPHLTRAYGGQHLGPSFYEYQENTNVERMKKLLEIFCQKIDDRSGGQCLQLVNKILVRVGDPMNEILETADEEECDVIVVGNHGKGFLKRSFLGSVSQSVLTRSKKPVFIIPMPSESSVAKDIIRGIDGGGVGVGI